MVGGEFLDGGHEAAGHLAQDLVAEDLVTADPGQEPAQAIGILEAGDVTVEEEAAFREPGPNPSNSHRRETRIGAPAA